jgi:hypothetical protein
MQVFTEGVYFLFDGDELVYIGTTDNLYRRIGEHIAEGKKVFNRFEFYPTEDRIRLEGFLIRTLKPKYNVSLGAAYELKHDGDLFPSQSIEEAIKKYEEYAGDPLVNEIADRIGTYRDALLRGLHLAGAPIYKIGGRFRVDKDWYLKNQENMWDYVPYE